VRGVADLAGARVLAVLGAEVNRHRLVTDPAAGVGRYPGPALARHAPNLPVRVVDSGDDGAMTEVVAAAELARPGDVVLLAPAAASMDMFSDYAHRGRVFAAAVAAPGHR
jgi:UDP-N-acetylmuramoylalanine--D-glutamate ligase